MNRLEESLNSSGNSINTLRECQAAINAAMDRLFKNGAPSESGPALGAFNMLANAISGIDSAIADIGNARTHIIAEAGKNDPIPDGLSWMQE